MGKEYYSEVKKNEKIAAKINPDLILLSETLFTIFWIR